MLARVHACNTLTDVIGVTEKGYEGSLVHKAMELIAPKRAVVFSS